MNNIEKNKVASLEIIVRMIDNKPYYEVKYREVGKEYYSVGYSSYDLKIVLDYIATYFEIVGSDRQTNADRIRSMSDEELAEEFLTDQLLNDQLPCGHCYYIRNNAYGCKYDSCKNGILKWLQSKTE